MKKPVPRSVSFEVPLGPIEDSRLHDKDAQAVIEFAEKEKKMQEEISAMAANDPLQSAAQPQQELQSKDAAVDVPPSLPLEVRAQSGQASSSAGNVEMDDPGLAVPVTPPREYVMVGTRRSCK